MKRERRIYNNRTARDKIVTIRITYENYEKAILCSKAAHMTLSSYIEWAVMRSFDSHALKDMYERNMADIRDALATFETKE